MIPAQNVFFRRSMLLAALTLAAVSPLHGQGKPLPPTEAPSMGELTKIIEDEVQDPGRRRELIVLGKEADSREIDLERLIDEFAGKLQALNRQYNATRDQFDELDIYYSTKIDWLRRRIAENIIAMQAAARQEEWKRIGGALAEGAPSGFGMAPGHRLEQFGSEMRARIQRTITGAGRQSRILILVDAMENELNGFEQSLKGSASRIANLIRHQGATREEFDWQFSAPENDLTGALHRIIEVRYSLRELVTPEEWKKIFPPGEE